MIVLIDADIVAYRCAVANEKSDVGIALWQVDEMMKRIIEDTEAASYEAFLTGSDNFRYSIYPDYKANRKDMTKPQWLGAIREHLVTRWGATVTSGHEADDSIASRQTQLRKEAGLL